VTDGTTLFEQVEAEINIYKQMATEGTGEFYTFTEWAAGLITKGAQEVVCDVDTKGRYLFGTAV